MSRTGRWRWLPGISRWRPGPWR
ncbi:MAG TPA: hypothetical protein DG577_10900 [Firmicutes bacterium]|nr:hypothetical protein [Bacillota bacterium]HCX79908.1 hypothetical protein [Bacillota bacterium]